MCLCLLGVYLLPDVSGIEGEEAYFADNDNSDEDSKDNAENHQHDGEKGPEKGTDKNITEPPAKRMKTGMCECSVLHWNSKIPSVSTTLKDLTTFNLATNSLVCNSKILFSLIS